MNARLSFRIIVLLSYMFIFKLFQAHLMKIAFTIDFYRHIPLQALSITCEFRFKFPISERFGAESSI